MLRGLYTSATGMATQRSRMDVVTNNIVNAQTTGFKRTMSCPLLLKRSC